MILLRNVTNVYHSVLNYIIFLMFHINLCYVSSIYFITLKLALFTRISIEFSFEYIASVLPTFPIS